MALADDEFNRILAGGTGLPAIDSPGTSSLKLSDFEMPDVEAQEAAPAPEAGALSNEEFQRLLGEGQPAAPTSSIRLQDFELMPVTGLPEDRTEIGKGLERGVIHTGALLTAGTGMLLGALGAEETERKLINKYRELMRDVEAEELRPEVGRVEDIHSAPDFLSWLAGVAGEQVPIMAGFLVSGGVGALLGKQVAKGVITKAVAKSAAEKAAKHNVEKLVAGRLGQKIVGKTAKAAAFGYASLLEGGGIYGEQVDEGLERNRAAAIGGGLFAGALELTPWVLLARSMGLGGAAVSTMTKALAAMPRAKRAALTGLMLAGSEAATEAGQELTAIAARKFVDENYQLLGEEAASRILNSAAAGLFMGGGVGVLGGALTSTREVPGPRDELPGVPGQEGEGGLEVPAATPKEATGEFEGFVGEPGESSAAVAAGYNETTLSAEEVITKLTANQAYFAEAAESAESTEQVTVEAAVKTALRPYASEETITAKLDTTRGGMGQAEIEEFGTVSFADDKAKRGKSFKEVELKPGEVVVAGFNGIPDLVKTENNKQNLRLGLFGSPVTLHSTFTELREKLLLQKKLAWDLNDLEAHAEAVQGLEALDKQEKQYRTRAMDAMRTVQNWVKRLAPDMRIIITDGEVGRALFAATGNRDLLIQGNAAAHHFRTQNGISIIQMNADRLVDRSRASVFSTLAHEFGHALMFHMYSKLSPKIQSALEAEYYRWLDYWMDRPVRDFFRSRGPASRFHNIPFEDYAGEVKLGEFDENETLRDYIKNWHDYHLERELRNPFNTPDQAEEFARKKAGYWVSYSEYFAEQVSRWALHDKKANTKTEKFFKNLAKKLREFFENAVRKYAPNVTFARFMERLRLENWAANYEPGNIADAHAAAEESQSVVTGIDLADVNAESVDKTISAAEDVATQDTGNDRKIPKARFGWFARWALTPIQVEQQNQEVPGVVRYWEAVRKWWTDKTRITDDADQVLGIWKKAKLSQSQKEALDKVLHEITLKSDKLQRKLTPEERAAMFKRFGLEGNEEAVRVFEEVQKFLQGSLNRYYQFAIKDAEIRNAENATARKAAVAEIMKEWQVMKNRDFFPLSRFGQYWVLIRSSKEMVNPDGGVLKAGETHRFYTFESEKQMKQELAEMRKQFGHRGFIVTGGKLDETTFVFQGMPPSLIKMMKERLRDAKVPLTKKQEEELDFLAYQMSPGQSYRKHLMKRKGIRGFSYDAKRSFAAYAMHFANHLSRLENYSEMNGALGELEDHTRALRRGAQAGENVKEVELLQYMREHYEYAMNPGNEWANLRSLGFLWYLGFMPKSAFVNLTQVPLVTYPYLASRYSDAGAVRELTWAMQNMGKIWKRGKGMPEQLQRAIEMGIEAGFLNESLATELAAIAEGSNLSTLLPGTFARSETGARYLRMASGAGAWMFQNAEKFNRLQTFVAAFQLESKGILKGRTWAQLTQQEHDSLMKQAYLAGRQAVESTQYEYARWNRPKFMRGKPSVVFLFWQYMQNTAYFAFAGPARLRFAIMMLALAGLSGYPFAEDLMDIVDFIATKMKGALGWKNPKTDVRLAVRDFVKELGANPDLIMHGLSRDSFGLGTVGEMVGMPIPRFDISGSLSMGRIVPGVEPAFGREGGYQDRLAAATADVGGAFFSIPLSMMQALADDNPDQFRRFERALPSFMKSISKSHRYLTEGGETTARGATIAELNPDDPQELMEILGQGLGFAPTKIAREREMRWMQKEHALYYQNRRQMLLWQLDYAFQLDDKDVIQEARDAIRKYNRQIPNARLRITSKDISKSLKMRRKRRRTESINQPYSKRERGLYRQIEESY